MLIMPVLAPLNIFPAPTADMYSTAEAFAFIEMLMAVKYMNIIMGVVCALALVCLWIGRVALSALLLLPITVNIVAFHLVLDGGLLTAGALMGNILLLLNLYFLWQSRGQYASLLKKSS